MSDLTGKLIANTYKDLLQIASSASNGGLDSTLRSVQDGSGNNSSLKISETSAAFTGNVSIAGSLNIGNAFTVGSIETALISATTIRGSTVSVTNITTDTLTAETLTFQDVSVSSLRTGSLTVTNNVTATAYYGDGSNLTGIASDTRIAAVSALTVVNQTSIAANASAVVALSATLETRIAAVSALTAVNKTSIAANASAVVALSATLETRIAAVSVLTATNKTSIAANASAVVALSATLETRIAAVSVLTATNKTSIAANASAVVALSATLETRIAAVSVLTATNKTSITANASTIVALSATLESRIAALSATVATSISNYLPLTGGSLTGVVTITTGDNNPQLVLKSTDADALSGPLLELFRDSSSPANNDLTGRISFQAEDSGSNKVTYSRINSYIDNVNAVSVTGKIEIATNQIGFSKSRIMFDGTEAVINDDGVDYDFRVESDTVANALFVQGSSGNVGINNASPATALDVTGDITVSGSIGIGESSPDTPLHITGTVPEITVEDNTGDVYKFGNNNGTFRVYNVTDTREDFKIDGGGNITVGGGIYIGGTGAANLLDDYEEGTYTVQLFDASSGGNASSTSVTGTYTKIGNLVTCKFDSLNNISTAGMTGTNDLYFSLPFAAGSTGRSAGSVVFDSLTFVTGRTMVTPLVLDSSSRGQFRTTGSAVTDQVSDVQDINSGTTDIHTFTLTYATA
tara:strand:- start:270 stop:2366 length:2097 start_codon:yes stop_codon:yes gene_type:complete